MDNDYFDQLPDVLDSLGLTPRELAGVHLATDGVLELDRTGGATLSLLIQGAFSGAIALELTLQHAVGVPGTLRLALRHGEVRRVRWPIAVAPDAEEVVVQLTSRLSPEAERIRPAWKLVDTWEAPPMAAAHQSGLMATYDLDSEGNEIGMMSRVRKASGSAKVLRVALARGSAPRGEAAFSDALVWDPSMPPPFETGPLPVPTRSELSALPFALEPRDRTVPDTAAPFEPRDRTALDSAAVPATSIDVVPILSSPDDDEVTATAVAPVVREVIREVPFGVFDDEVTATSVSPVVAHEEPPTVATPVRARRSPFTWRPCIECGADVNLARAEESGMCPQCGAAWY